jgi:hypothetical protein
MSVLVCAAATRADFFTSDANRIQRDASGAHGGIPGAIPV